MWGYLGKLGSMLHNKRVYSFRVMQVYKICIHLRKGVLFPYAKQTLAIIYASYTFGILQECTPFHMHKCAGPALQTLL